MAPWLQHLTVNTVGRQPGAELWKGRETTTEAGEKGQRKQLLRGRAKQPINANARTDIYDDGMLLVPWSEEWIAQDESIATSFQTKQKIKYKLILRSHLLAAPYRAASEICSYSIHDSGHARVIEFFLRDVKWNNISRLISNRYRTSFNVDEYLGIIIIYSWTCNSRRNDEGLEQIANFEEKSNESVGRLGGIKWNEQFPWKRFAAYTKTKRND